MDNNTLIHEKVAEFYSCPNCNYLEGVDKYFCENNTFNWEEIGSLLQHVIPGYEITIQDFSSLKYEHHLILVRRLYPIYVKCIEVSEGISTDSSSLCWLGPNNFAIKALIKSRDIAEITSNYEYVLLLTSMLEFALGNVYYTTTKGKLPPHLLRDLLNTNEILQVFGWEAVWFLKILLGTPNSINLRNIVWHGFPQPAEIPRHLVAVLITAIHTLGTTINDQQLILLQRPQIADLSRYVTKIENSLGKFELDSEAVQFSCTLLSQGHKLFWEQLLVYFKNENWWQFVVLVLPQIELLLRVIYGNVNDFDVRAKLDEYYITMDTIFDQRVPSPDQRFNKLLQSDVYISDGCLKLLYDLFMAPFGPRLRDKVSHGEVSLSCVDNSSICGILLQISIELMSQGQLTSLTRYESLFHLNSLASQSIQVAKTSLLSLLKLPLPQNFQFQADQMKFISSSSFTTIKIFHRHKKEPELAQLLLKIAQLIIQTCENYKESVSDRITMLKLRELRSKRRRTLEKMLETMPHIWNTLSLILYCLEITLINLQKNNEEVFTDQGFCTISRFLKHSLKVLENFVKYSARESNEWIKALELCSKFEESRKRYFYLNPS